MEIYSVSNPDKFMCIKYVLHTTGDLNAYRIRGKMSLFSSLTYCWGPGVERNEVNQRTDETDRACYI